jgi:hypothetical protein
MEDGSVFMWFVKGRLDEQWMEEKAIRKREREERRAGK